jgi:hypothetical protein
LRGVDDQEHVAVDDRFLHPRRQPGAVPGGWPSRALARKPPKRRLKSRESRAPCLPEKTSCPLSDRRGKTRVKR